MTDSWVPNTGLNQNFEMKQKIENKTCWWEGNLRETYENGVLWMKTDWKKPLQFQKHFNYREDAWKSGWQNLFTGCQLHLSFPATSEISQKSIVQVSTAAQIWGFAWAQYLQLMKAYLTYCTPYSPSVEANDEPSF